MARADVPCPRCGRMMELSRMVRGVRYETNAKRQEVAVPISEVECP